MSPSRIFFTSCIFFILGVFIRSVFALDFFYFYLILLASLLFFILSLRNKYFLILGLWGIFLFLGILRYDLSLPRNLSDEINFYNDQKVEFIGIVSKEPDVREDKVKLEIKTLQILLDNQWQKVSGKVLASKELFPEYNYGDKLRIVCQLQTPGKIEEFAYDEYLARYEIYSLCYQPKITLLEQNQGNFFLAGIYQAKSFFVSKINRVMPEPQASFLGGLLLGAKKSIPAYLQTVFSITGTTHMVAVSGYNITIIAAFLMSLFLYVGFGRKKAFGLILGSLIIFIILTGAQSSIVRAGIMGGLVLLANYMGRLSKIKIALTAAAAFMLLANPKILVFDLGFQLSFLATLGLVYLSPVLLKIFKVEKIKYKFLKTVLGDYLITTISAIIMTQPLILYKFGKISAIAPIANILTLPFVPLAMLLGFITGILAMIWQTAGWIFGWSVWLVLSYILWVLQKLASLSWAYWEIPKISLWLMAVMYIIICGGIFINKRSEKK